MGKEIRRIPSDWEHPKYKKEEIKYDWQKDAYHPLYDEDYDSACKQWYEEAANFKGDGICRWYHEYNGDPPDQAYYRNRKWTKEEAIYYQVYETVSEGTPVTPAFATKEELINYLIENGDYWDQKRGNDGWERKSAEFFVNSARARSMVVIKSEEGITIKTPRDGI